MRNIVSPLDGFQSPFGSVSALSIYAVAGFEPPLVADFDDEYYRTGGSPTTFDSMFTHSRLSNATMVDSDGVLKWGPHNLALNSASPATQSITVISGADYTVECTGVSIVLSGAGTGTVTEGNPVEITASTTTLTLTVTGSTGTMWCYRSDLGGMVNNPDTGNSYVPTTSSAVYLPRRGNHVYNGTSWVNEGLLIETEARTNLLTYSEDFTDATWINVDTSDTITSTVGPDGYSFMTRLYENIATNRHILYQSFSGALDVTRTLSVFVKKPATNGRQYVALSVPNAGDTLAYSAIFDLDSGLVTATKVNGTATISLAEIQDFGSGIYRCILAGNSNSASSAAFYPMIALSDRSDFSGTLVSGNLPSYTGDGTSGVYIWGAQLEEGSTPSSYIPTSGATVNRTPDILTIPSANLPWPTPKVIGPELVTNGDFSSPTGWTLDAASSISGGVLSTTKADAGEIASQVIPITAGKVYLIQYTVLSTNGEVIVPRLSGNPGSSAPATSTTGTFQAVVTAVSNEDKFAFNVAGAGVTATIDNVSVREIDPLAVSIQMDGRMTYADTGNTELIFLNWMADSGNYIQANLRTQTTATGEVYQIQAAAGVADDVDGRSSQYSPGTLVPFNIASRHGSTFINGAVDGTALAADNTPVALPDLSSTNLSLAYDYMGTIRQFRVFAADLGDAGIEEAST
jgi:hypothetical protein